MLFFDQELKRAISVYTGQEGMFANFATFCNAAYKLTQEEPKS